MNDVEHAVAGKVRMVSEADNKSWAIRKAYRRCSGALLLLSLSKVIASLRLTLEYRVPTERAEGLGTPGDASESSICRRLGYGDDQAAI